MGDFLDRLLDAGGKIFDKFIDYETAQNESRRAAAIDRAALQAQLRSQQFSSPTAPQVQQRWTDPNANNALLIAAGVAGAGVLLFLVAKK